MTSTSGVDGNSATLKVDDQKCIGVGTCVGLAPGAFKMDGTGVALVQDPIVGASDAVLAEAVASCPMQAIYWVEG